jgi:phosphoglycerate kinase
MGFWKRTVREYDLHSKTVLVRADYNVPITEDGEIADDYRIQQSLPTLNFLLEQNCKIIICSHLGRPGGKPAAEFSLRPVAKRLSQLLDMHVSFAEDCVGEKAETAVSGMHHGQVLLLENLRFHPEEEANDDGFAQQLAKLAEVFVQDGFGVVHRAHASTEAIVRHIPGVGGLLLEREVGTIVDVMDNPERPLATIVGGAKISDKIAILHRFIDIADFVAVGGAMANTFLLAEGIEIGKSKAEEDEVPLAKEIIEKARQKAQEKRFVFYLPQDAVVAKSMDKNAKTRIVDWDAHAVASIENYPNRPKRETAQVEEDEMILDIGPFSGAFIAGATQLASTVIWNGTMGVTEVKGVQGPVGPFSHGTDILVDAILGEHGHKPFTVVGGGDTVSYVSGRGLTGSFNHVSTGGGATLELMSGQRLPGVEALWNKD